VSRTDVSEHISDLRVRRGTAKESQLANGCRQPALRCRSGGLKPGPTGRPFPPAVVDSSNRRRATLLRRVITLDDVEVPARRLAID
jgi:hypothetical protein